MRWLRTREQVGCERAIKKEQEKSITDPTKAGREILVIKERKGTAKTAKQTPGGRKKRLFGPQHADHALEDSVGALVAIGPLLDLGLPPKSSLIGDTGVSSSNLFPPSLSDPLIDSARFLLVLLFFSPTCCLALATFLPRRALGKRSLGGQ
jgi:hypothetical protein